MFMLLIGALLASAVLLRHMPLLALAGVYFIYSAKVEEHYLTERFPDAYPVYKRSTKMLVPLIF